MEHGERPDSTRKKRKRRNKALVSDNEISTALVNQLTVRKETETNLLQMEEKRIGLGRDRAED